ncbi:MAG: sialate O-acetylesterase [Limisphaerales bacterium]
MRTSQHYGACWFASIITFVLAATNVFADVQLPAMFSDHMVLQRDVSVPIWGWADPGEEVTVKIDKQVRHARADKHGKWMVKLKKLKAGLSTTLSVEGKNKILMNDVLIGEVWLCSGQSNMGMTVERSKNFDAEKAAANFPSIRMFTVGRNSQPTTQSQCTGTWVICSPESVGKFSAAAYFFGREIHQRLKVPVGLINSSWGGTAIEAWTSMNAQTPLPEFLTISADWFKALRNWDEAKAAADYEQQRTGWVAAVKKAKSEHTTPPREPQKPTNPRLHQNFPANLYNGMISPLIPYAIRGAIWYQGENNAIGKFPTIYGLQLRTMIADWRARWGYDFPFAWVQLPEFLEPQREPVEPGGWPTVRNEMLKTLNVPRTGMAITLGLGDAKDIHPKNKQEVGKRLAMWALSDVYGDKSTVASGPLPTRFKIKGSNVIVSFKYANGGLTTNGQTLKGFAIAGADHKWVRADAKIEGNKVIISNLDVQRPLAVRYAWAANPEFSLFNKAGLSATPFRTDSWKE